MMKRSFIVLLAALVMLFALAICASAACDHNWRIDYTKCVAATCTETGKNVYVCSRCSETKTEKTTATGHDYVKVSGTSATCDKDSTAVEKCSVCNNEKVDTTKALGHNYKETKRVAATCAKKGSVTYTCERCKGTKVEELATVAHDFSKFISSSATCTTKGQSTYQCSMCPELTLKTVNSLGHSFKLSGGPTCTERGKYIRTCTRCGYQKTDTTYTKALGHDVPEKLSEWKVMKKATCEVDGQLRAKCERCNNYVYETVKKTEHEYSEELFVTRVPTATTTGRYAKVCENCGDAVEGNITKGKTDLSAYSVPLVVASEEPGDVARGTKITLSCELSGTDIYYTLDGKSPLSSKNRIKYEEPIVVTETVYVRALAVYNSEKVTISPSETKTFVYDIDDDEPWVYFASDAYLGGYMPLKKNEKFRPDDKATRYEVINALDNLMLSWADDADIDFTDVDKEYKNVVKKFVGAKLLNGYEDLTFRGNANIKRGELCKVLAIALGLEVKSYVKADFPDVPRDHWASTYIAALTKAGYLAGDTNGNFRPEDNITRAELAVVLNRIAEVDDSEGVAIPDVKSDHWAYKYICSAVEKLK